MKGMWVGYDVGCTVGLTLGHGAWQINRPSNGSMWNSYSFQPVGQWMSYSIHWSRGWGVLSFSERLVTTLSRHRHWQVLSLFHVSGCPYGTVQPRSSTTPGVLLMTSIPSCPYHLIVIPKLTRLGILSSSTQGEQQFEKRLNFNPWLEKFLNFVWALKIAWNPWKVLELFNYTDPS